MGVGRKALFFAWIILYLIIPIIELAYGVNYSSRGIPCPGVAVIYPCLIGVGVAEVILLVAILLIVYFHYTNSGNIVHHTIRLASNLEGSQQADYIKYTWRIVVYCLTILLVLLTAGFFFALHQVFAVQGTVQFTNRAASTYCDQQLYQTCYALLIASYIVGFLLLVFGIFIYAFKKNKN